MYPEDLAAQLDLVNSTREQRKAVIPASLAPQEKITLLKKYHPDYRIPRSESCGSGPTRRPGNP